MKVNTPNVASERRRNSKGNRVERSKRDREGEGMKEDEREEVARAKRATITGTKGQSGTRGRQMMI